MHLPSRVTTSLCILLIGSLGGAALAGPPQRTLPVDPIELIAGRETAGSEELTLEHEGYTYRFLNAENRSAFQKNPGKYAVADGGACGRMGPLSGLGDARRYAVHEGRIYFFASDGCRAAFLKEPAKYIETADEMPFGSNEQVLAGRAILDKVVAWAGGAETLRGVKSFRATAVRKEKQGDKDWTVSEETAIAFPDRYYDKEAWDEHWFATLSGPAGGASASADRKERLAESRMQAFVRSMARWPVVVLKAHVDGAPKADCPGLVVIADGEGELDRTPVEYVKVWLNGGTSRLTVEKATGRLLQMAFRGRDASLRRADCVRTFTAYSTTGGVTLPIAHTQAFDGKSSAQGERRIDAFEINPELQTTLFEAPSGFP